MAPVDGTEVVCSGEVVDHANPEVVLHVERCIVASSSQLHHVRARVRCQSKLPHFPELLACLLKHADHALDIDLDWIQAHIETESEQVDVGASALILPKQFVLLHQHQHGAEYLLQHGAQV